MTGAGIPQRILFYTPHPVRRGDLVTYEAGEGPLSGIVVGVRSSPTGLQALIVGERGMVSVGVRQVMLEASAA